MDRIRSKFFLMLPVFLLTGCMAEKPDMPRIFWPPPPQSPQIEFLGVFASMDDFPKTRWQEFLDEFLGKPPFQRLRSPAGVFVDEEGKVYVLDARERIFYVFDIRGKKLEFLFQGLLPVFEKPSDAALDAEGNLYVLDSAKKKVLVFSAGMKPLFSFGETESLGQPEYLVIHKGLRRVYISDAKNNRIEAYDFHGKHLFSFGEKGGKEREFLKPHGMAIDERGRLFVADTGNARIQVFDADGNFLCLFGNFDEKGSLLTKPQDLAFDSQGNLHVIDKGSAALITFNAKGDLLFATGAQRPSNHLLGLARPAAIYVDSTDRIIITDKFNRRFSVWQCLYANYLSDHPVTNDDVKRMLAFSERLKKEDRERRGGEQEVLVAKVKKHRGAVKVVLLRTLDGAPVSFPEERFKVFCPNCGKEMEISGRGRADHKKMDDLQKPTAENDKKGGLARLGS